MGLVDEAYFFYAPKIIGGKDAHPAIGGTGSSKASDAAVIEHIKQKKLGDDWLVTGTVSGHLESLWSR
jgi:diaminohydroxyphosphoribosylaminopyrimidine deaminase/5-amino-6-(5-phosphoribosylamino)uracil reductase